MQRFEVVLFPAQTVLFPGTLMPIRVSRGAHYDTLEHCVQTDAPLGVVLVELTSEGQAVLAEVGTLALLQNPEMDASGTIRVLAVGSDRFRILRLLRDTPYLVVEAERLQDESAEDYPDIERPLGDLSQRFSRYASLAMQLPDADAQIQLPRGAVERVNLICSALMIPLPQKQRLLEETSLPRRIKLATAIVQRETCELEAFHAAIRVLTGSVEPTSPYPFSLN